jgi:hypothetical protein
LGFTGYYRYFIKGYSQIARPLLELTRKGTPWHWDDPQQKAFETLKRKMCEKPVLANPDPKKVFYSAGQQKSTNFFRVLFLLENAK